MNLMHLFIILHIALICISLGCAKSMGNRQAKQRARKRPGKHLRMLKKMLRRLTPSVVMALARSKKTGMEFGRYVENEEHKETHLQSIPEVECPQAEDGMKLFACPTPDESGNFQCIDDHALCDRRRHCPNGEDEDRTVCMFHKMTMNYFKKFMDMVLKFPKRMQ